MFLNGIFMKRTRRRLPANQRGSTLVIGIFVITVMFLLAGALLDIVQDSDEGLSQEVWGTRALAAANSGADAAMATLFPLSGVTGSCPASSSWMPPDVVGFHACGVNLTCSSHTVGSQVQYKITSKAVCQSGTLRVSRQVEVEARGN
jgi:MSHA biogenesis protein MshP